MAKGYDEVNPFDFGMTIDNVLLVFELRGV